MTNYLLFFNCLLLTLFLLVLAFGLLFCKNKNFENLYLYYLILILNKFYLKFMVKLIKLTDLHILSITFFTCNHVL